MPTSAVILTAVILTGVILSDLGRRAVTTHRVLRPLIIAGVAGALYLSALATSGAGLAIELAGVATGALLGLFAARFMRVEHDSASGETYTRAGLPYLLVWVLTAAARLAFIYGTNHWFSASLDSWMLAHHITAAALTDALVLEALAMAIARTISLFVRGRLDANPQRGGQPSGESAI